jgi:large subunit ribosomal protein L25
MEQLALKAFYRPVGSKGDLKQLRRKGMVPGVVYGRGKEPVTITVNSRDLSRILATPAGTNVLVDLSIEKGKKSFRETVMFKEIQHDIFLPEAYAHVDLMRISMTDKIEIQVPLSFVGEPRGVANGGVVQILMREVAVKCLPSEIPGYIEVDVRSVDIGQNLTVGDIVLPEGLEMIEDEDETIFIVTAPTAMEEEPSAEEAPEEGEGVEEGERETILPAEEAEGKEE